MSDPVAELDSDVDGLLGFSEQEPVLHTQLLHDEFCRLLLLIILGLG
jgi:hypothetical protein